MNWNAADNSLTLQDEFVGDGDITLKSITFQIEYSPVGSITEYSVGDGTGCGFNVAVSAGNVQEVNFDQPFTNTAIFVPGTTTQDCDNAKGFFVLPAQYASTLIAGMHLNYFGARYYDADVGIWTSCDPKHKFWSPYSYTGNGISPIIGIDPNGKAVTIAIYRTGQNDNVTRGVFRVSSDIVDNTFTGYTLEPATMDSKFKLGAGTYTAYQRNRSARTKDYPEGREYNPERIQLNNALSENGENYAAQIHIGNSYDDTQGCILVGGGEGPNNTLTGGTSENALEWINNIIDKDASGEINVIIYDEDLLATRG
jgi:RHS repeat-associated protein